MIVAGGCHCGLVRFEASVPGPALEVRACACSRCRMTGHLHLLVPETRFRLVEGQRETSSYRFASGKARHVFCSQCGVESFFRPAAPAGMMSINYRCLDEDQGLSATILPLD
ncbi:GFA family protein [Sphingomonas morindae]|uniref:GFA family protein n=1 Tax=Sphingomonas morindae TaxID=1541170 RepID=A0ABY4XAW3_9SPHN|nr:GFA family protein [Sphingomonas morindae]USI74095.1 GFA family protein [Sphingomonas morindae]